MLQDGASTALVLFLFKAPARLPSLNLARYVRPESLNQSVPPVKTRYLQGVHIREFSTQEVGLIVDL